MSAKIADTNNPQGLRDRQRALDLDERRTPLQVGFWARATVNERQRSALPPRMPRDVMDWLPGLNAEELRRLSRASTAAIRLIAGVCGGRIDSVRSVQPLQRCVLRFSKLLPPAEELPDPAGGGGGQKRRFG
ncbi:hypothetical protein RAD16_32610 [Bradyrhizobium sp. 18BD]